MKVAFDTSVLVPALVEDLERHARAYAWLDAARRGTVEGIASCHAIAETYAVLTRLPREPALSPRGAREVLKRLTDVIAPCSLAPALYDRALDRAAERRVRSGAIFDALHLVSAEDEGADVFLTFNGADFKALANADSPEIVEPPDPPSVPRAFPRKKRSRQR